MRTCFFAVTEIEFNEKFYKSKMKLNSSKDPPPQEFIDVI